MWLKRALDHLLYTHIYIGLCAGALCWGMFSLLGGGEDQIPFTLFAICGTIWVYNLHRTIGLRNSNKQNRPERFKVFYRVRSVNIFLSAATMILALYLFFTYLMDYWQLISPPIAVSLIYVFPLSTKRLVRSIPYLKIFLISFTWAWITVVVPGNLSNAIPDVLIWLLFTERFLFIMAIDIPFDIRDHEQDTLQSVDTLVHHLGIQSSKRLSYFLLVACGLISLLIVIQFYMVTPYAIAHWFVYLIAFILILFVRKDRKDFYYTFGLDGSMLIMGLLEVGVIAWCALLI